MPLLSLIYFFSASKMYQEVVRDWTKEVTCWITCKRCILYYIIYILLSNAENICWVIFYLLLRILNPFTTYLCILVHYVFYHTSILLFQTIQEIPGSSQSLTNSPISVPLSQLQQNKLTPQGKNSWKL